MVRIRKENLEDEIEEEETEEVSNKRQTLRFFGPESRNILVPYEINPDTAILLTDQIYMAASLSEDPIVLHINCSGGHIHSCINIMDAIMSVTNHVAGYVSGFAASCGFDILQACDERLMTQYSQLIWHQPQLVNMEAKSLKDMEGWKIYYRNLSTGPDSLLRKKSGMTKAEWKKYFEGDVDVYFNAKDSLKLGLVDKVIRYGKKN